CGIAVAACRTRAVCLKNATLGWLGVVTRSVPTRRAERIGVQSATLRRGFDEGEDFLRRDCGTDALDAGAGGTPCPGHSRDRNLYRRKDNGTAHFLFAEQHRFLAEEHVETHG